MKPQEAELVSEISKLQGMVSELKSGFSGALMELSQIQHGDSDLREELQENRRSCRKKALRVEALVEALRDELGVMSGQILQLYRQKPLEEDKSATAKSGDVCERRTQCVCAASCVSRGKLLLHCFLQGLKAGLNEGTDARHQVAMQLLHSEWEYVSTLNQLYDKYRKPPDHLMTLEP
ncbi:rho guanine nucleotide exchange factor 33 [Notothenia coriiceps]|uniref:Rho guanine nucleotide exchange factor 33 n=1 Tax=Notothenia coriiceps TaxID=8208 RepID=A0A6I9NTW1_9TELE|nr:PREDICTED: rho guanine nucleotide exchange factor 33 [Notothenia coriiceps]